MNFHIQNLYIWLKNGKRRTITFLPNKVNIITGDSLTGKTAILDIIDYCLFASEHSISEADINERAEWYGLRIAIEGKTYTIARRAPTERTVSMDYYFSSIGEVPSGCPEVNNTDLALKRMLGADFGIDQDAKVSFGGRMIKAGSKVSLRYFLLFNTISGDIINHTTDFFDKQSNNRYREALPRTFDLAVGIDTVSNILKREKRSELEKSLKRLEKENDAKSKKQGIFLNQLSDIGRRAKEFGLVDEDMSVENTVAQLKNMVAQQSAQQKDVGTSRYDHLVAETNKISLKIRNLKRFSSEYSRYKKSLEATSDSLKPLDFLSNNYKTLVRTSIFNELLNSLRDDQNEIKKTIAKHTPLDSNISDIIKDLDREKRRIDSDLSNLPTTAKSLETDRDKYFFLGEINAKLDLYAGQKDVENVKSDEKIDNLQNQIALLDVQSVEDRKNLFITVMNETTQSYLLQSSSAFGKYASYNTYFDYKDKRLFLKKPMALSTENVGSSSNDMFLHLFFFLGLHKIIQSNGVPHVAPFLIIDQFSRPYWGDRNNEKEKLDSPDVAKVKTALSLLNNFIEDALDNNKNFQMIVFEHIPESYWEGMDYIHLVETFEDGNALIPMELADD